MRTDPLARTEFPHKRHCVGCGVIYFAFSAHVEFVTASLTGSTRLLLSFAVVGRFWMAHHRIFGSIARFDTNLVVINLAYLAFIALIALVNAGVGWLGGLVGIEGLTLERILGWMLAPLALAMGVRPGDAAEVAVEQHRRDRLLEIEVRGRGRGAQHARVR